ncbi:ATP-dependent helicase HrpB [Thermomonospora amylolytica]|uniref:ATP-dependent helicase HrpB n=1 Tax=Thermomonospora amylolytica TaxID=1411117 RepID=UPI000E6C16C6|nr:ATP-dependent helicase HrpB [Thermomonospora amylolytica]
MPADRTDLPVRPAIPALHAALARAGAAVLAAPPGTGKTTLVPLALAGALPNVPGGPDGPRRVLVVEPRRPAVRAAARRMAWLLGERVGERVGFAVRGEHRPGSLVEVVTTGVLLRRLQDDPELAGVDAVLLDECHERHLDADTALAFLLDVRAALRPDLRLVAASATADTRPWAELLDGPVVESAAEMHPVEIVWAPPARPIPPPHGMRVDPAFLEHVAATVRRALAERDGDVLCFLPGVGEIARVAAMLADIGPVADLLEVHGRAAPAVQDAVLSPGARRRVVLATAVAESSLTVPGVRIVVDSGLAREPRTDHARGLSALTTVRASRAAADQRAGRAGRQGPGTVYRCWTAAEHERLPERPRPEIELADLTAFALQAACWGDPDAKGLALLDAPPQAALRAARDTLRAIGAVGPDGRVTERGRRMARVGVHPRLARALIDGSALVGERAAAEVVALLSEPPPGGAGDDLAAVLRSVRSGRRDPAHADRWRRETRRLLRALPDPSGRSGEVDDAAVGTVVALAFPERVARARGGRRYLMASGTGAELAEGSALAPSAPRWLAIAVADRPAGSPSARIRQAVPIDEEVARLAAAPLLAETEEVRWRDGDVAARRVERLGAVELASVPLADPDPDLVAGALREGLRRAGLALLTWTPEASALRDRLAFCRRALGDPWPDVSDDALLEAVIDGWSDGLRDRADLARLDVAEVLRGLLPWECAARLDEVAPERITVPSGSRIRVDYRGEQPVLAVKLQETFGWQAAPRLAAGRVPLVLHLLSPAGRPAAVTADLASFWRDGYRAVRAELRGRYPRHPWPEDPLTARPTRRANPRR